MPAIASESGKTLSHCLFMISAVAQYHFFVFDLAAMMKASNKIDVTFL